MPAAVGLLAALAVIQTVIILQSRSAVATAAPTPATGMVRLETTPPGATVSLNGQSRGATPLALPLAPGEYAFDLTSNGQTRRVPATVTAGAEVALHIQLGDARSTGSLQISSQPPGVGISVDGTPYGSTPLTIPDLRAGEHTVILDGAIEVRQTVAVQPGTTSSLMVSVVAPPATSKEVAPPATSKAAVSPVAAAAEGWLIVTAPFDVELFERGQLLGTNQSDRIMLPAGNHQIDLVNERLGYRATQMIKIEPEEVARVLAYVPRASVDVNALPWADVWVGGELVGQTPIGNLSVPIGTYEIVFRHPDLGEQRVTTTVTVNGPNRVRANFR